MRQVDIKNFENYQVTDDGRIWSKTKNYYLNPFDVGGYLRVSLYKDGKCHPTFVHKIVAEAFVNNPNNFTEINHKDENPYNNNASNLEYCTHLYNMRYGTRIKRQIDSISKTVYQYTLNNVLVAVWKNAFEAAEKLCISRSGICNCCKGGYNRKGKWVSVTQHKGYKWSYEPL